MWQIAEKNRKNMTQDRKAWEKMKYRNLMCRKPWPGSKTNIGGHTSFMQILPKENNAACHTTHIAQS